MPSEQAEGGDYSPTSLEDPPNKVRQKREKQQHEHTAHPDQKVQGHLWIVDFFFVHGSRYHQVEEKTSGSHGISSLQFTRRFLVFANRPSQIHCQHL